MSLRRTDAAAFDRYAGAACGLVIGDAHCAPFEGGLLERLLWRCIGRTHGMRRYTDDSQMAFDLGRHLASHATIDQDILAQSFAQSHRWSRGYGPSTTAVLKRIRRGLPWEQATRAQFKDGSFGNGAAMRVAMLPIFLHGRSHFSPLATWVEAASVVTHPHPLALAGAQTVAQVIDGCLAGQPVLTVSAGLTALALPPNYRVKIEQLHQWLADKQQPGLAELRKLLGTATAAEDSCPMAIYIGLAHAEQPLHALLEQVNALGGDTDTIGAMAAAIWGAANGLSRIPASFMTSTEGIESMQDLVRDLRQQVPQQLTGAVQ